MAPKNIIEKIWDSHIVTHVEGHPPVVAADLMLIHEVTSAQAFDTLREKKLDVVDRSRFLATLDHSVPTRVNRDEIFDPAAKKQVETLRRNCKEFGIPLLDYETGQGVVHVVGPELGVVQPGMIIVCGDSHTATHGAFGALAFGIGTSEVAHVLATGCLLQQKPKTMRVEFKGRFKKGVYAKDAILKLIADIGVGGANGYAIEYCGDAIRSMSMEARMTVCNMSIECGARAGLIAADETTFAYLEGKPKVPRGSRFQEACAYWRSVVSDAGCSYDKELIIDVSSLEPMVTWGTNPAQACQLGEVIPELTRFSESERESVRRALEYIALNSGSGIAETPVDWAFVGSCTNGRIEDLRLAAQILKGRKIHPSVTMYVVPGSERVKAQAEKEGLDEIFRAAGADFRMPGCSMCLGMNDDKVPEGKRCISTSNRNFMGRQGPGSRTHLASPATVAASAIEGKIVSGEKYL